MPPGRQHLWLGARRMVRALVKTPEVKAVGLFGSLTDKTTNTTPHDVDLVVFSNVLYEKAGSRYALHLEREKDLLGLGLSSAGTEKVRLVLKAFPLVTFDVVVFPEQCTDDFLIIVAKSNDPQFLVNVAGSIKFWNPLNDDFESSHSVWSSFQTALNLPVPPKVPAVPSFVRIHVVGSMEAGQGSCFLIRDGSSTTAFDCGASPTTGNGVSLGHTTERIVREVVSANPQKIVITHFHYDHWGALVRVLEEMARRRMTLPDLVTTDQTFALLKRHISPSGLVRRWPRVEYHRETDRIKLIPNNHSVPGSASALFRGSKTLFYTGDLHSIELPPGFPAVDCLLIDSTGALKKSPRLDNEAGIRATIASLIEKTLQRDPYATVYVALFSTQLERAAYLQAAAKRITGRLPTINGNSLFHNLSAYNRTVSTFANKSVVLTTGVWAQGDSRWFGEGASALVRISTGTDRHCQVKAGDVVILCGSIPTWSDVLTRQIEMMCRRLHQRGARVIVDVTAPEDWQRFAERKEVHAGGHGHLPEITGLIDRIQPRRVVPFHASLEAREAVAAYCKTNGIPAVLTTSSFITI